MQRHDIDLLSLIPGIVLVVIAVGLLLDGADAVSLDGGWVAPLLLIGLGVAGLATAWQRASRR